MICVLLFNNYHVEASAESSLPSIEKDPGNPKKGICLDLMDVQASSNGY